MNTWKHKIQNILEFLVLLPIYIYRGAISPYTRSSCRYMLTCSQYAIEAVKKHGIVKGFFLALKRIMRCHP